MAMVEMVFVLPLLILIVFAIAQFGLMFSRWLTLSNAVREGAREGVTFVGLKCPGDTANIEDRVKAKVVSYAQAGGLPLQTTAVNVDNVCAGAGTQLTVDATYNFPISIPFASLSGVPLSYSSTMRNEG
jgi:Flp pilus assembly protein TadG